GNVVASSALSSRVVSSTTPIAWSSTHRRAMWSMRAGDLVRCDFGVPQRGEAGFVRPAVILTSDEVLAFRQHAVVVVPCTTTVRGWVTEVEIDGCGVAQAHLPTTISVDRIVDPTGTNVGPVALRQI